ncbi:ArsR/SmtB family transcription factor [Litoreibacter roseus]|uniref:Transcriptional regulator n=1 Tax=Litoreibacter roseus TaxID=2601869 RepID=A0A6N6JKA9_9RHOB|nr:metalloregulator ArsR/SmtB family transcription factor [Litoreibacter roseus]GFE66763.1 transcriptional regulator [Litoreibacter roseus]
MSDQIVAVDRATQIKALSSEVRMKVLRLLADPKGNFPDQWSADPATEGVCMSLIAEAIGVAQPTASRHLDILRQARFVTVTRIGKWGHCKRDDAAIRDYLTWVEEELEL